MSAMWNNSTKTSNLSSDDLRRGLELMQSKEWQDRQWEKRKAILEGQNVLILGYHQGVLSQEEVMSLWPSVGLNGGLIVHPRWKEKLSRIQIDPPHASSG